MKFLIMPHRRHRAQQFFRCCACTRCHWNMFTEPILATTFSSGLYIPGFQTLQGTQKLTASKVIS
jgi:hypothetical protein